MNVFRSTHAQSDAVAKIAHLTSVFERLVAQAGAQRGRIEQMLAEMAEERDDTVNELIRAPAQRAA
jgi:hypothetical protein